MAYEMVMPYHLHMPSYFLETFTEYPSYNTQNHMNIIVYKKTHILYFCQFTRHRINYKSPHYNIFRY